MGAVASDADEPIQALVRATDDNGLTDISSVRLHVFDPQLTYLGWVPCDPLGGGLFSYTSGKLPAVTPGTWYAVLIAPWNPRSAPSTKLMK